MSSDKKSQKNFEQKKKEFLDSLEPDDFRNAGSFNQAEFIIDELYRVMQKKQNPEEFIKKSLSNLFRENSVASLKANDLLSKN